MVRASSAHEGDDTGRTSVQANAPPRRTKNQEVQERTG